MNEMIYKVMKRTGGGNIALGILSIVVGTACGTLLIISGAKLLKSKSEILF